MTRENKAGLVVCGSFLCLVAAVVAVKLRQPPASDAPPVSPTLALNTVASPEKGKPETPPEPPPHPPTTEPPAVPAAPTAPTGPSVEPPPSAPLPPGPAVGEPNHNEPVAPPPAPGPSAVLPPSDPPPLPPPPGHDSDPPMTPAVVTPLPAPPPVGPPTVADAALEKKDRPGDEAPGHAPKKPKRPGEAGENVVALPSDPPDPPAPPAVPMNPAAEDMQPKKEPNPVKNGDNAVVVPPVPGPAADPDAPPKAPGPGAPELPPLPGPPEPPAPLATPAPKAVEPPPLPSNVKLEPPSPALVAPAPVKPITIEPDAPADPPVKPGNVGVIPADPPAPAPAPARPPAAVPSGPLVDSWDEQTYVSRPGDDFAAISRNTYRTDIYARALELYNRNHPRASDAMRTSGTLAPGEKVYIPPSEILQKRHGDAIAKAKPAPVGAATPAGSGAVQAGFQTVAPAAPTYKVVGSPEFMADIAQRTLGDTGRWGELVKLNPLIDTLKPVPVGTVLTLPPGAHGSPPAAH